MRVRSPLLIPIVLVGGKWSGARVYLDAVETTVALGDEVHIEGFAQEYYDETELVVDAGGVLDVTGSGRVTVDSLSAIPSDWEPWEGAVVELEDVSATAPTDDYGLTLTNWSLYLDDCIFDYTAEYNAGRTYASITGAVRWSYDEQKLCPRFAADLVE
ncbi:hypothetical protein LBMAG42_08880 [Deltaproteobacteria bacterium]|nr:hypothetical protein LBMAG42_08880 [Deltaproteobacteria bacterium]